MTDLTAAGHFSSMEVALKTPGRWTSSFSLLDRVRIAVSGEEGVVIAVWINNQFTVRYCQADGVAVERVWSADALLPADGAEVIELKTVS